MVERTKPSIKPNSTFSLCLSLSSPISPCLLRSLSSLISLLAPTSITDTFFCSLLLQSETPPPALIGIPHVPIETLLQYRQPLMLQSKTPPAPISICLLRFLTSLISFLAPTSITDIIISFLLLQSKIPLQSESLMFQLKPSCSITTPPAPIETPLSSNLPLSSPISLFYDLSSCPNFHHRYLPLFSPSPIGNPPLQSESLIFQSKPSCSNGQPLLLQSKPLLLQSEPLSPPTASPLPSPSAPSLTYPFSFSTETLTKHPLSYTPPHSLPLSLILDFAHLPLKLL